MLTPSAYGTDQNVARWYLDEARQVERNVVDQMTAATSRHEQCERRVKQIQLAIESDLFEELDTDGMDRVRQIAASVRIQYRLLNNLVTGIKPLADLCDETLTQYLAAERLQQPGRAQQAEDKLKQLLGQVHELAAEATSVYELLQQQTDEQHSIFERMKR